MAAFTGRAANNIFGMTLHSLLNLPVSGPFVNLRGMQLEQLQERFTPGSILIIDEYSMVGYRLLGQIDQRLRQATGRLQEPFGGISVIIVGDILQLPPVRDKPLFAGSTPSEREEFQRGRAAFSMFKTVCELTINQRQSDPNEEPYRQLLMNLRKGKHNSRQAYELLQSRMIGFVPVETMNEFKKSAVSLNPCNAKVDIDNNNALRELASNPNDSERQRICRIEAVSFILFNSEKKF